MWHQGQFQRSIRLRWERFEVAEDFNRTSGLLTYDKESMWPACHHWARISVAGKNQYHGKINSTNCRWTRISESRSVIFTKWNWFYRCTDFASYWDPGSVMTCRSHRFFIISEKSRCLIKVFGNLKSLPPQSDCSLELPLVSHALLSQLKMSSSSTESRLSFSFGPLQFPEEVYQHFLKIFFLLE